MQIKKQKGGVLLEAMAVLGLMTVATPMVYKKAIEKTKEIEDITVASQMRTVRDAAATYIEKNYDAVADGEKITLSQLNQYLPPNFINNLSRNLVPDGASADEAMTVIIKKDDGVVGNNALPLKKASAYIITNNVVGTGKVDTKRSNRIASLIGSEGGYAIDDKTIYGSNHGWERDVSNLTAKDGSMPVLQEGQIVIGTTFSKNPLSGDFLYRNQVEGFPQFNMMMTNLDINGNSIEKVRSLGLKYHNDDTFNSIEFNGESGEMVGKNISGKTTVTMKTNDENNGGSLEVNADGENDGCAKVEGNYNGTGAGGMSACNSMGKKTVSLSAANPDDKDKQHGVMSVRKADDSNEAIAYGNYIDNKGNASGGAFELRNNNGLTNTLLIAQQHEKDTFSEKVGNTYMYGMGDDFKGENAAKIQLYSTDSGAEQLKTYISATDTGARFAITDTDAMYGTQTVTGDAGKATVTAKKDGISAKMTAKLDYDNLGAALTIGNGEANTDIIGVLANKNNSGYLRLSSNSYTGKRMEMQGSGGGVTDLYGAGAGKVHLSAKDTKMQFVSGNASATVSAGSFNAVKGNTVIDLSGGNAGTLSMDGKSTYGSAFMSADIQKNGYNNQNGPALTLQKNGNETTAYAAVKGESDAPTAGVKNSDGSFANLYSKYAKTDTINNNTSVSAVMQLAKSGNKTIGAYADVSNGKYGNGGTVSAFSSAGGGVNIHANMVNKNTSYGNSVSGGGVVAEKSSNIGTAWLIGGGSNDGGMFSIGKDGSESNRVDMYGAGGNGVNMGGTAHVYGASGEVASIYGNYGKYSGNASGMNGSGGDFSNRGVYGTSGDYAMTEVSGDAVASTVNTTDIYVQKKILSSAPDGKFDKLYTNVWCIGAQNNSGKTAAGLIDNFKGANTVSNLNLDANGDKQCIPLPPTATWKEIIYKALAKKMQPKSTGNAERGHEHPGFLPLDHEHPSYMRTDTESDHHDYVGEADFIQTGKEWYDSDNAHIVGTVCLGGSTSGTVDGGKGGNPGPRSANTSQPAFHYTLYRSLTDTSGYFECPSTTYTNVCAVSIRCDVGDGKEYKSGGCTVRTKNTGYGYNVYSDYTCSKSESYYGYDVFAYRDCDPDIFDYHTCSGKYREGNCTTLTESECSGKRNECSYTASKPAVPASCSGTYINSKGKTKSCSGLSKTSCGSQSGCTYNKAESEVKFSCTGTFYKNCTGLSRSVCPTKTGCSLTEYATRKCTQYVKRRTSANCTCDTTSPDGTDSFYHRCCYSSSPDAKYSGVGGKNGNLKTIYDGRNSYWRSTNRTVAK